MLASYRLGCLIATVAVLGIGCTPRLEERRIANLPAHNVLVSPGVTTSPGVTAPLGRVEHSGVTIPRGTSAVPPGMRVSVVAPPGVTTAPARPPEQVYGFPETRAELKLRESLQCLKNEMEQLREALDAPHD